MFEKLIIKIAMKKILKQLFQKNSLKSKTVWFGLLQILFSVGNAYFTGSHTRGYYRRYYRRSNPWV